MRSEERGVPEKERRAEDVSTEERGARVVVDIGVWGSEPLDRAGVTAFFAGAGNAGDDDDDDDDLGSSSALSSSL